MKPRRVTILRKGLLVIALPLIYQALFIGVLLKRQSEHNEAQRWAVHTKDMLIQTDRVFRLLLAGQGDLRGLILTGNELFAADIAANEKAVEVELDTMRALILDSPKQRARFERVAAAVAARLEYQQRMVALMRAEGRERGVQIFQDLEGRDLMRALLKEIEAFRAVEEKLDQARLEDLRLSSVTQNWLLVGGLVFNIGIGALAAVMFSREISDRLLVVTENTRRIARGETLPEIVAGTDEIHELDEKLHLLAGELTTAQRKDRESQATIERRASALARANRDLEHKNQEIEMFVYSVSHDLRSPLVNLQGFSRELGLAREELQMLLVADLAGPARERAKTLIDREVGESVHYIQTAVTRLSSIIDALLRLSRAGRVEYRPQWVDLKETVFRIVQAMRGSILDRGAEVVIGELPPVLADPTAIDQIFANLIGNAVNYLDPLRPGRIEIGAVARAVDELPSAQTYFVKDNGLGIATAYLPKVFAIFQRLHGDRATGEGVGLALVRRMVERHGGRVWVESVEGEGSTFFVAFPKSSENQPYVGIAPRKESISVLARSA